MTYIQYVFECPQCHIRRTEQYPGHEKGLPNPHCHFCQIPMYTVAGSETYVHKNTDQGDTRSSAVDMLKDEDKALLIESRLMRALSDFHRVRKGCYYHGGGE